MVGGNKTMKRQFLLEIDIEEGITRYFLPSPKGVSEDSIKKFSNFLDNSNKEFVITHKLSIDQMKLIWVLCTELGELIGYERDDMREIIQSNFCASREYEDFSISPRKNNAATMEIASEFTQYIIEFAIEEGYNLILHEGHGENKTKKHMREVVPDIRRYVLACLLNKKCAICGTTHNIDLHHWDTANSIGGYKKDDGLKTRFISLCRSHHTLFHSLGENEFKNRYHLEGIMLSENIVNHLKKNKIYGNHFKAFEVKI